MSTKSAPDTVGSGWHALTQELKTLKMTNPKMLLILEGLQSSKCFWLRSESSRSCLSGCIRTGAPMLMEERHAISRQTCSAPPEWLAAL